MRGLLLALGALAFLGACDFVRFPGDGRPPPETPPDVPPGAPGPPPPATPVEDPYGTGAPPEEPPAGETPSGDAPAAEPPAPDTPATDTPGADTPPSDPPAPDAPPEIPAPPPETPPGTPGNGTTPISRPEPEPPAPSPVEPVFTYYAPGALLPGSGTGTSNQIVHAPGITFPIKSAPAYLQSQVFTFGGGVVGGDQCDPRNYAYPWRDNFCETRTANRTSPFCPTPKIHLGQDIRVGTPEECRALRRQPPAQRGIHEVVAVEDGIISSIGTYTVKLRANGRIYNYMHLNMARLAVTEGQAVRAGDLIGYNSNDFGGTPTTLHLHFEIVQNTAAHGWVHVPPYLSLVEAYERREGGPGKQLEPEVGVASAPQWVIPEGLEIID